MSRKTVVRFVQNFIAEEVDRQKRTAEKNGGANGVLFNEGNLVLLSTVTYHVSCALILRSTSVP